jgi:hypothetical protein
MRKVKTIPEKELEGIKIVVNAYKVWASSKEESFSFLGSLDDTCQFNDKEYKIGYLLNELEKNSRLGRQFANAVYDSSQKSNSLESMAEFAESNPKKVPKLFAGSTEIPSSVLFKGLFSNPEYQKANNLINYFQAIYQLTHKAA